MNTPRRAEGPPEWSFRRTSPRGGPAVQYGDHRRYTCPPKGDGSLNRWLRATIVALVIGLTGTAAMAAPASATAPVPRVALIVGPAGSITDAYRRLADEAAAAAAAQGAEVIRVYSPNATWPEVKRATAGASIIVYLGHGNGWPSRYRDALYPPTQNGFGLNPVANGDDSTHQYFGEAAIERLDFAPNAVVVLSHLCYASGNTEPGLSEGTRSEAIQRVDNYASGFLRAGARAVIADTKASPAWYVRALLRSRHSVERIWAQAPTAVGRHPIVAPSVRSPGFGLRLDPQRADGGYTRSLVGGPLTAAEMRASALGATGGTIAVPVIPTLARAGLRFAEPVLQRLPVAGTTTRVTLPLATGRTTAIPAGARLSMRWDLILADPPAAPRPSPTETAQPSPAPTPAATGSPAVTVPASPTVDPAAIERFLRPTTPVAPAPSPTARPSPTADPAPHAPDVDLVVPVQAGTVVEPIAVRRGPRGIALDVAYPRVPGLYRLTATLHTPEGVAYDAATQALLTPVIVHVGGPTAVAYGAPATLSLAAGSTTDVAVAVLNAGSVRWSAVVRAAPSDPVTLAPDATAAPDLGAAIVLPRLVATWVSPDGRPVPAALTVDLPGAAWAPGGGAEVMLALVAPAEPGAYLLLLDVVTPEHGALSAIGSSPAMIRVTVSGPATAAPAPAAAPSPAPFPAPFPTADGES